METFYTEQWMTAPPLTVVGTQTVLEAAVLMKKKNVGSLVVLDSSTLGPDGMFSKSELLTVVASGKDPSKVLVKDVMADELIVVERKTPINEVIRMMVDKSIQRLPVVDSSEYTVPKLVGVLTMTQVLKRLSRLDDLEDIKKILTME